AVEVAVADRVLSAEMSPAGSVPEPAQPLVLVPRQALRAVEVAPGEVVLGFEVSRVGGLEVQAQHLRLLRVVPAVVLPVLRGPCRRRITLIRPVFGGPAVVGGQGAPFEGGGGAARRRRRGAARP